MDGCADRWMVGWMVGLVCESADGFINGWIGL